MHEKPKKPTVSEIEAVLALAERILLLKEEGLDIVKKMDNFSDYEEYERDTMVEREAHRLKNKILMEEYKLSPDEMRLVLEYKKSKASAERQLNCAVFEDIESDAFKKHLKDIIEDGEVGKRFQVMVRNPKAGLSPHWSTADILIEKDGIRILHFDALKATAHRMVSRKGGLNGDALEEVLKSLDSSKPISLVDAYTQVEDKIVDLQHENISCNLFAIATALDMSKIPHLHELAKPHADRFEGSPVKNNVTRYSIDALHLPACFVRNAQSRALTDYYDQHQSEALKTIPRKSGPKTLKQYVDSRSHVATQKDNALKLQNFGIMHTRAHYKKVVEKQKEVKVEHSSKSVKK